jgi:glutamate/aspartate transport system permease protein
MDVPTFLNNIYALFVALIKYNVTLTFFAVLFAFPIASFLALGRLSKHKLIYIPVTVYINILRSSPILMVMFWVYYTFPMLIKGNLDAYYSALIALTAFEAAYFAEFLRTGLQSVRKDQRLVALSTGLKPSQVSFYIVWPQAVRRMIPSLLTQTIIAFQDSTLASVIGVREMVRMTAIINARQVRPIWLYTMLAVIYLVLCIALSFLVRKIEKKTYEQLNV